MWCCNNDGNVGKVRATQQWLWLLFSQTLAFGRRRHHCASVLDMFVLIDVMMCLLLKVLYLGQNRLSMIFDFTFSYMSNLRVLRLNENGLSAIYERNFDGLENLMSLSIDHNNIRSVDQSVLSQYSRLIN